VLTENFSYHFTKLKELDAPKFVQVVKKHLFPWGSERNRQLDKMYVEYVPYSLELQASSSDIGLF
jgi:hypothetical protein